MKSLVLTPSQARFPARCVGCGASPSHDVTLESFRGVDLLYFRWGNRCEVPMPMCQRCWAQRWRRRVGWFAALTGGIVGVIGACAALASGNDELGPIVVGALVVVLVPLLMYLRAREQELFQSLASPVWLRGWKPKENRVELCFRDDALAEEVAVLSGLSAPPAGDANYREPARVLPPPAWTGPKPRQVPWWLALVIGAVFFAVAIGEFIQYSELEATGRSFSDEALFVWIYELGGKYTLSGMLVAFGIFFVAGGFVLRKILKKQV